MIMNYINYKIINETINKITGNPEKGIIIFDLVGDDYKTYSNYKNNVEIIKEISK